MSNETKRDVLDDAAFNIETSAPDGPKFADELRQRYAVALPDDLPVIPKRVSEEIRDGYGKNSLLDELAWANRDALPSSEVSEWINSNESIFAEAWSCGLWIVEETGKVTAYDK